MGKIEVKICMGTMCYVMGGAELKAAIDSLPQDEQEKIQVSYSPCLGMCNDGGEPPYVQINGRTSPRKYYWTHTNIKGRIAQCFMTIMQCSPNVSC